MHSSAFGKLYHINTDTLIKQNFVLKEIGFELFLKIWQIPQWYCFISTCPVGHLEGENNCNEDKIVKYWYELDEYEYFFSN